MNKLTGFGVIILYQQEFDGSYYSCNLSFAAFTLAVTQSVLYLTTQCTCPLGKKKIEKIKKDND